MSTFTKFHIIVEQYDVYTEVTTRLFNGNYQVVLITGRH